MMFLAGSAFLGSSGFYAPDTLISLAAIAKYGGGAWAFGSATKKLSDKMEQEAESKINEIDGKQEVLLIESQGDTVSAQGISKEARNRIAKAEVQEWLHEEDNFVGS